MLTLPDLQAAELRFGLEIETFLTLCATHRVRRGAAEDLSAFPWQISSQPEFQRDLIAFVGRLQRHGNLPDPFADVLAIFLVGISGPSAARAGIQFQSSTDMLINFLVTLDGWSGEDLAYATMLADEIRDGLSREQTIHEAEPLIEPSAAARLVEEVNLSPTSDNLRDVIARLERSNHDLRQKLEAMDQRIRRIDPFPSSSDYPARQLPEIHNQTARAASGPGDSGFHRAPAFHGGLLSRPEGLSQENALPPHGVDTKINSVADPDLLIPEDRAVRTPAATFLQETPAAASSQGAEASIAAPTASAAHLNPELAAVPPPAATARSPVAQAPRAGTRLLTDQEHLADRRRISAPLRRRRLIQAAVFATTALVAAGGFFYSSGHRVDTPSHSAGQEADSPAAARSGQVSASPDVSANALDSATDPLPEKPSSPPSHVTIYSPGTSAPVASASNRRKPSALLSEGTKGRSTLDPIQPSSSPTGRSAGSSEPLSVSSSVMAQRLLSSTPPSYPRLARLTSLQGVVVLRATIAKDGSVERVRALGGHYLLRGAAAEAVRSWRYKPYYLNGRPVEVATLVTIDFALSR